MPVTESKPEVLSTLTSEQVDFYNQNGYLAAGPIVSEEKLNELNDYVNDLIKKNEGKLRPEKLNMPHVDEPYLLDFLTQPNILNLVESLIGPNIVLFASHFICKPAGDGMPVPWHQDSGYWTNLAMPRKVVTIWLAVDDTDTENGCMRVIPGSQNLRLEDEYEKAAPGSVFGNELKRDSFDESKAVDLILPRGHCSFHDGWTIHGSNANKSSRRRCGYTMRYFSTEQIHLKKDHALYLARGEDKIGENNYLPLPSR